jgi:hypothetical protein
MSSVSFSNLPFRSQAQSATERLLAPQAEALQVTRAKQPVAQKDIKPVQSEVAQAPAVTLPSTVDMRFEFNALTQAWMLAMTDASSGDVVRKIALKGFSSSSAGLHQTGHWIDKAV